MSGRNRVLRQLLVGALSLAMVMSGTPAEALAEAQQEVADALSQEVEATEEEAPEAELGEEEVAEVVVEAAGAEEAVALGGDELTTDVAVPEEEAIPEEEVASEDDAEIEVMEPEAQDSFIPGFEDTDELLLANPDDPESLGATEQEEPEELGASHSGTSGSCTWSISDSGYLYVRPTSGSVGYLDPEPGWLNYKTSVKTVYFAYGVIGKFYSLAGMFSGFTNVTSIDIHNFSDPVVNNMEGFFHGCSKLTDITVPGKFVTSSVTDLSSFFYECTSLQGLKISDWNTSGVTDMNSFCYGCTSLQSAKVAGLNVSKVRDMSWMFANCKNLTSIDLSTWRPSSVTNASYLLGGCWALKTANLASWPCSKLANVTSMFQYDSALQVVDLSGWNCASLTTATNCFNGNSALKSWTISNSWPVNLSGAVPAATVSSGWYSTRDKGWYSASSIANNRRRTADTYITVARSAVYRMYNTKTSEHLYTTGLGEYNACGTGNYRDWRAEGVGWLAPNSSSAPVYRLYNPLSGDHHYTTSRAERDGLVDRHGWRYETIAFYSGGSAPLYRLYNPRLKRGQHHYTLSAAERDNLANNHGWRKEGIGFYGYNL